MWLPIEIQEVVVDGLEQFAAHSDGMTLADSTPGDDAEWIAWAEAVVEGDWAAYELGFLAAPMT
jgi:hypothetical protein